jgi:ubiquinone biosynthesis protein UbiJ
MAGPYAPWWEEPPYESPQEEIADLKEQEAFLREELEAIQQRLAELEKASQE